MSGEKRAYGTACAISHRPPYRTAPPIFYRCGICGAVHVRISPAAGSDGASGCVCCAAPMGRLACDSGTLSQEHQLDYTVFGGFQHNTIRVAVGEGTHPMNAGHHIEWIYLYTYQGGQMKYLPLKGPSSALFSLAEEDAYVYCDRPVCRMGWEHCQFQCKRGHIAYAYCNEHGLYRLAF